MNEPVQRDRGGRPLVVPPGGGKPVAYTRTTTLAKTLEDVGGLSKWIMRMTALGLVARPDLYQLVATSADDKGALDRICEQAKEHAGGSARANIGTALHAATEHVDRNGGDPVTCTGVLEQFRPAVTAYRQALDAAGIQTSPRWVERFVVLDDWQVAGTFDRLVRLPDGRLVIADLKTGADLRYSWRSIAVQLAVYAHGLLYDDDGTRSPLPDALDPTIGVVMHLPAGEERCELYEVDLVAGWEAAEHSMWARTWRKANVARKITAVEQRASQGPSAPAVQGAAGDPSTPAAPADPAPLAAQRDAHRRGLLVARCRWLAEHQPAFTPALKALWPAGLPTLASSYAHTATELDAIEDAVVAAAAHVEAPFEPRPDQPPPEPRLRIVTDAPAGDPFDGLNGQPPDLAPADVCDALVARLAALPPDLLADVEVPLKAAGVPNLRSGRATLGHVDQIEARLAKVEPLYAERAAAVAALLDGMSQAEMAQLAYWATNGRRTLDRLTEGDVYTLEALVDCIGQGLTVTFDQSGEAAFDVDADELTRRLLAAHTTKAAVLAAAKSAADALDVPAPRSTAQVAADAALAARVLRDAGMVFTG